MDFATYRSLPLPEYVSFQRVLAHFRKQQAEADGNYPPTDNTGMPFLGAQMPLHHANGAGQRAKYCWAEVQGKTREMFERGRLIVPASDSEIAEHNQALAARAASEWKHIQAMSDDYLAETVRCVGLPPAGNRAAMLAQLKAVWIKKGLDPKEANHGIT